MKDNRGEITIMMIIIVIVLIIFVQIIQALGNYLARRARVRR